MAEEVGSLDDDGRGVIVDLIEDIALPLGCRLLTEQCWRVVEVGADDVAIMRMKAAREDDLVLAGEALGH